MKKVSWVEEDYLQAVLRLCQPKARSLESLPELCRYFFTDSYLMDEKTAAKISKKSDPKAILTPIVPLLEAHDCFTADAIYEALQDYSESQGVKVFSYFPALRFALSGQSGGPDLMPMLEVLGRARVVRRLQAFLA